MPVIKRLINKHKRQSWRQYVRVYIQPSRARYKSLNHSRQNEPRKFRRFLSRILYHTRYTRAGRRRRAFVSSATEQERAEKQSTRPINCGASFLLVRRALLYSCFLVLFDKGKRRPSDIPVNLSPTSNERHLYVYNNFHAYERALIRREALRILRAISSWRCSRRMYNYNVGDEVQRIVG